MTVRQSNTCADWEGEHGPASSSSSVHMSSRRPVCTTPIWRDSPSALQPLLHAPDKSSGPHLVLGVPWQLPWPLLSNPFNFRCRTGLHSRPAPRYLLGGTMQHTTLRMKIMRPNVQLHRHLGAGGLYTGCCLRRCAPSVAGKGTRTPHCSTRRRFHAPL